MDSKDTQPRRRLIDILLDGQYGNLRNTWDRTEAAADFTPLPAGTYECCVHSIELFNARTGTPGVKIRFDVCAGEHAGRVLFHDCWLTPAALPQTKRDCLKLGLDSLDKLESAAARRSASGTGGASAQRRTCPNRARRCRWSKRCCSKPRSTAACRLVTRGEQSKTAGGGGGAKRLPPREHATMSNYQILGELLAGWRALLSGPPPELCPVGTGGLATVEAGPGRIVLLGGQPGIGKTSLAMQLVVDGLRLTPALRALVCNVEMSPAILLDRQLARLSGVPLTVISKRQLGPEHAERINRGLATLESVADRLAFVVPPFNRENIARAVEDFGGRLLVLDYLQRIQPLGEHADKRLSVNALMDSLRRLADTGFGVLAVAAVGRTRDRRGRSSYTPGGLGLGSYRESSEIEYGADSAYLLLPAAADDLESVVLQCCKNRFGELVDVPLRFDRARQSFAPIEQATNNDSPQLVKLRQLRHRTPAAERDG